MQDSSNFKSVRFSTIGNEEQPRNSDTPVGDFPLDEPSRYTHNAVVCVHEWTYSQKNLLEGP